MMLQNQRRQSFFQIRLFVLVILVAMGCALTVPPETRDDSAKSPEQTLHAPAEEIWRAIANAVERQSITSTAQLAQVVVRLAENGDLSDTDAAKLDAVFPNLTKIQRELTSDDAKILRGIK